MRNLTIFATCAMLFLAACGQHDHPSQETTKSAAPAQSEPAATTSPSPATEVTYACPMHPEVTGKAGDKCPKCKMDLKPVQK